VIHALLRIRREFDAAHQLPHHDGQCRRLHGHRWKVELAIAGPIREDHPDDPQSGMVVDYSNVKKLLDAYLPDHFSMNHADAAAEHGMVDPQDSRGSEWSRGLANPTSENFARLLYDDFRPIIKDMGLTLVQVRVWETPNADCTYPATPEVQRVLQ